MPIISRVEALNYRCLRYISQPLRPFQILVGANATGKSAFLDVINLLGDFLKLGLEDALLIRERPSYSPGGVRARVSELIFNQVADHFELAIEINIPDSVNQGTLSSRYKRARYFISLGQTSPKGELLVRGERSGSMLKSGKKGIRQSRSYYSPVNLRFQRPYSICSMAADGGRS